MKFKKFRRECPWRQRIRSDVPKCGVNVSYTGTRSVRDIDCKKKNCGLWYLFK